MIPKTPFVEYSSDITENGYKLICFPYAGGGASYYIKWLKELPSYEILPIQLPGRENRIKEELMTDLNEIADTIVRELLPYLKSGKFSVFGHSMGGLIGFEVAKRLEDNNLFPQMCFISSTTAKGNYHKKRVADMDNDEFLASVAEYGAIDENNTIIQYPQLFDIFIKILRADFTVVEAYKRTSQKLRCPITAFCGNKDPMETIEKMREWENFTEVSVNYKKYRGDHFYIDTNLRTLCRDIDNILKDNTHNKTSLL